MLDGPTIAYLLSAGKPDRRREQRIEHEAVGAAEIYFEIRPIFFGHPPVLLPGISEGTFEAEACAVKIYFPKRLVSADNRASFLPITHEEALIDRRFRRKYIPQKYFLGVTPP